MWSVITQDSYRYGVWGELVTPNYIAERALNYADAVSYTHLLDITNLELVST